MRRWRELRVNKWTHTKEWILKMRQKAEECTVNPFFAHFFCNELLSNRSRLNCISIFFVQVFGKWEWKEWERKKGKEINSYLQVVCTTQRQTHGFIWCTEHTQKISHPLIYAHSKDFLTLSPRREKDCTNIEIYLLLMRDTSQPKISYV